MSQCRGHQVYYPRRCRYRSCNGCLRQRGGGVCTSRAADEIIFNVMHRPSVVSDLLKYIWRVAVESYVPSRRQNHLPYDSVCPCFHTVLLGSQVDQLFLLGTLSSRMRVLAVGFRSSYKSYFPRTPISIQDRRITPAPTSEKLSLSRANYVMNIITHP